MTALTPPAWMDRAVCADPSLGIGADWWFPDLGNNAAIARHYCATCPVQAPCLDMALSFSEHDDHGIWGGTSPDERRALRRLRRAA